MAACRTARCLGSYRKKTVKCAEGTADFDCAHLVDVHIGERIQPRDSRSFLVHGDLKRSRCRLALRPTGGAGKASGRHLPQWHADEGRRIPRIAAMCAELVGMDKVTVERHPNAGSTLCLSLTGAIERRRAVPGFAKCGPCSLQFNSL